MEEIDRSKAYRKLIESRDRQIHELQEQLRAQEEKYRFAFSSKPDDAGRASRSSKDIEVIEALQRRLAEAENRANNFRSQYENEAQKNRNAAAQTNSDGAGGHGVFKKVIENKDRQIRELQAQRAQLEEDRSHILEQLRKAEEREENEDSLRSNLKSHSRELDLLRERHDVLLDENSVLRDHNRDLEEILVRKDKDVQQMTTIIRQKSVQIEDLNRELQNQDLQVENLLKKLDMAKEDLRLAETELRSMKDELRIKHDELRGKEEEALASRRGARAGSGLEGELESLRAKVKDLEAEKLAISRVNEALKQQHTLSPTIPQTLASVTAPQATAGYKRNSVVVSGSPAGLLSVFMEHFTGCALTVTGIHKDVGFSVLTGSGSYEGECWIQWYRSTNGSNFGPIQGAVNPSYMPTADDIGTYLRLECTPVSLTGTKAQPFLADISRIELDPSMDKFVRAYVKAGKAQFYVMLTGDVPDEQRVILLDKRGISVQNKIDNSEQLFPYNSHMAIEMHPGILMTFTLRVDPNQRFLFRTTTSLERDLIALTVRNFVAMMTERPRSSTSSTSRTSFPFRSNSKPPGPAPTGAKFRVGD